MFAKTFGDFVLKVQKPRDLKVLALVFYSRMLKKQVGVRERSQ